MAQSAKKNQNKTIIVLGGFGFIGNHIVEYLRREKYRAIPASRRSGLNLLDLHQTTNYFAKTDPKVIINCATHKGSVHYVSRLPASILDDDLRMALNLYKATRKSCPTAIIINFLPNCTYPGNAKIQKESHWLNGPVHDSVASYGNMKRMTQAISQCYAIEHRLVTKNFIIPNVYGPNDYLDPDRTHALNGMIIRMIRAKKQKDLQFIIWGTGNPLREWIYVEDVARFIIKDIDTTAPRIYPLNIAQNKAYSVVNIARKIKFALQYPGILTFDTSYQDGALIKKLDDTEFRKEFPKFTFTDLTVGIHKTIRYYQNRV